MEKQKDNQGMHQVLFDVANRLGGQVTTSQLYANSNLSLEEIEKILSELSAKSHIISEIDEKNSVVNYIFPQLKQENRKELISLSEKIGLDKILLRHKYREFQGNPLADLEKAVLQVAQDFNGELTIAKLIEYTDLEFTEAESLLNLLCAKGFCDKIFSSDFSHTFYFFRELHTSPITEKNVSENFSKQLLSSFQKNTNKLLIKSKVHKHRQKMKSKMFFDLIIPGLGHLSDGRWKTTQFLFYSLIPLFMTAGLAYLPTMYICRRKTLEYYSISSELFQKNKNKLGKKTLFYSVVWSYLYFRLIGLEGIYAYYKFMLYLIF